MDETKPASKELTDQTYTVYVVLHGEIAVFEDKDCLRLYAPAMPDHVYMAGSWMGERHIPAGSTLKLCGTSPVDEPDSIHAHTDTMVVLKHAVPSPVGSNFEIRMPKPKHIYAGYVVQFGTIDPGDAAEQDPKFIDLRPVFVYDALTPNVYLQLIAGSASSNYMPGATVWTAGEGQGNSLSLHIFAESDVPVGKDHADMAFHMAAGILGTDASIEFPLGENVIRQGEFGGALHVSELAMSLSDRLYVEAALGTQLRKAPSEDPMPPLRWDPLAAPESGTSHGSCGPVGG